MSERYSKKRRLTTIPLIQYLKISISGYQNSRKINLKFFYAILREDDTLVVDESKLWSIVKKNI